MTVWEEPIQFQWDAGNREKNWIKHGVTTEECEEAFADPHKRMVSSALHVGGETRYVLFGHTQTNRLLVVVFTTRGQKVRVISARDIHRKERGLYEETTQGA